MKLDWLKIISLVIGLAGGYYGYLGHVKEAEINAKLEMFKIAAERGWFDKAFDDMVNQDSVTAVQQKLINFAMDNLTH